MTGIEGLQIGIYERLKAEGIDVYPYTPERASYPFVALGEEHLVDVSTKNMQRYEITHVLHTFSESKTKKGINEVNNKVIRALCQPFSIGGGFSISRAQIEYMQTMIDPDVDGVFHGVLRFVFTISKG